MQTEIQSLSQKICISLREAFRDIESWSHAEVRSNAFWTGRVKDAVSKLAKDCRVRLSDQGSNWEFLYDVCFLNTGKQAVEDGYFVEGFYLRRMIMALEYEWDKRASVVY